LEFVDLVQLGVVGLLEAIDRFVPMRGVRFETFATYRIEGAILNGLPSYSEFQRQLATRRSLLRDRTESLRHEDIEQGRTALEQLGDLAISLALGFALEAEDEQPDEPAGPDNAYVRLELVQLRRRLAELVKQLPEAECRVVVRHYFQQQPFEEIALGMALTKGRISQIHHSALRRLKERLRALKSDSVLG